MVDSTEVQISAVSPEALVDAAEQLKDRGNIGIAFTYNEPLIGYEFLIDTARQIRDAGMKNVLVSNGSCSREVAMEVIPLMDAMNIDLKAFSAAGYKKLGGDIEQTQAFIELAAKSMSTGGTHLELTTLIVPGFNDSEQDMIEEAKWIASLNDDIVLHVTRFFPRYKMSDGEPTDVRLVYKLADTARKYLHNVFTGNC
jgi:Pyruvate-formate lyase-activating enzyme